MLAPPPIQLPASAAMPAQVSPATVSGWIARITRNATTAPSMMLAEAPRYISTSFGPSRRMPLMSTARVNRISAAGNRMSRATGL
ncbi:hypothetical protein D3C72_1864120 [compost metagenome]